MLVDMDAGRRPPLDPAKVWEIDDPDLTGFSNEERELRLRLSREIRDGTFRIPPLPQVALELNNLANSADPDINDAVRLIKRDAQLAAKVLQIASSAAYGARSAITDLKRATLRIGINGLRDIAFAIIVGNVFRAGALDKLMRDQARHAFVVACGSAWICRTLAMDSKSGFLCGLLHDMGRQAMLSAFGKWGKREPRWLNPAAISNVIGVMHAEVGLLVTSRWGMSDMVKACARYHHDPHQAQGSEVMPLVYAVAIADQADEIVASGPEERAEQLARDSVGFELGLQAGDFLSLASLIDQARDDAAIVSLTK
jgi:HD-like signal output (HDOD) protein